MIVLLSNYNRSISIWKKGTGEEFFSFSVSFSFSHPTLTHAGKDSPPAATLHSRPKESTPDATPAPGNYNPEPHETSPKYTFGLKVQHEKPSSTPGSFRALLLAHGRTFAPLRPRAKPTREVQESSKRCPIDFALFDLKANRFASIILNFCLGSNESNFY